MDKIFISIFLCFCFACNMNGNKSSSSQVTFSENGDTASVKYYHLNGKLREVIYYKENHPDTSFAFTTNQDTLIFPGLLLNYDSSQLIVFVPQMYNFTNIDIRNFEKQERIFSGQVKDGEHIGLTTMDHSKSVLAIFYCTDKYTGKVNVFPFKLAWNDTIKKPVGL